MSVYTYETKETTYRDYTRVRARVGIAIIHKRSDRRLWFAVHRNPTKHRSLDIIIYYMCVRVKEREIRGTVAEI